MALLPIWNTLVTDFDCYSARLLEFAGSKTIVSSSDFSFADECLLEGLLSRIWQSWNAFCRACVVKSCIGTTTYDGKAVTGLPSAISDAHVSSAAIACKRPACVRFWGATNNLLRIEPTWGDVDVIVKIIGILGPTNSAQLLAGFSASHSTAKALQFIRNAAAHTNSQTMQDVNRLRSTHIVFPIAHPTQALFWTVPSTKDFLIASALDELKACAMVAIS